MIDASNQPEWLEKWRRTAGTPEALPAPAPVTTVDPTRQRPDGRFLPGVSGNPKGRKPGQLDTRQKLQNAFAEDVLDIAKAVVAKAKEGDIGAANIVLSRLLPPLRQQAERVQFELSRDVPLSEQAAQIVLAVASGLVDAETAKMLVTLLGAVADMKAIENLESRLLVLESKQIG